MAISSQVVNVSDEEISEIKSSALPKTTQNATKYGVSLFRWAYYFALKLYRTVSTTTAETADCLKS